MELLCIIIKAFIWLSQPLSVRQIYMRFSSLPEKMSAGCLPYFPWLHFPAAVALGLTGWWWGWEVFQISNSNCHFIIFVYLYWHLFCVAALNPIQERKVLGCIMGNTTFNRSPLFRGAVKIKLTLNKSNAKLLSDVNPPPEPWSLFFLTLQQHLLCGSPGTCVTANWPKENGFMAYTLTQKLMRWWDLGWESKRLFISGKKEGRKSDSSYTNICFVPCRAGNGSWRAPCVLCAAG